MAKATPDSLKQASDKLHRHYEREYAGQSRHTRELTQLERLIDKTRVLVRKAKKLRGKGAQETSELVTQRLTLYQTERDAIAEARFERPEIGEGRELHARAHRLQRRYRRHFGGVSRLECDGDELARIAEEVAEVEGRLRTLLAETKLLELTAGLEQAKSLGLIVKDEIGEIAKALRGADDAALVARRKALANKLIDAYRIHFAGHARVSCSPDRLRAMIPRLEALRADMADPEVAADHLEDLEVVDGHLEIWRDELMALESTHAEASSKEIAGALGQAANHIFGLYAEHFAGQSRKTRNRRLLSDMCDRLADLRDQMAAGDDSLNLRNLSVVTQRLQTYEAEYDQILEAQSEDIATIRMG